MRRDGERLGARQTGEQAKFKRFEDFVTEKPLEGLGTNVDLIRRICAADKETLDLLDQALQRPEGKPLETYDNVKGLESAPTGNSAEQALRRLRKDRPDLHARVLANEISPHRAMIDAGFRKPTVQVPIDPIAASRRV